MPQFFINSQSIVNNKCSITGDDFYHLLQVRRVKINDSVFLRNDKGSLLTAKVLKIKDQEIELEILKEEIPQNHFPKITLGLSLLKGKKFDLVLQKATELGVHKIIPLLTERSVSIPSDQIKKDIKVARWKKIVSAASKQAMVTTVPGIEEIKSWEEVISNFTEKNRYFAHFGLKMA